MNIEIDDHKIALLVNAITAELKPFTKTQSLRARVSGIVLEHLKPKEVKVPKEEVSEEHKAPMPRFEDPLSGEVAKRLCDKIEKWHRDKCQEVYNELASWETPPVSFIEPENLPPDIAEFREKTGAAVNKAAKQALAHFNEATSDALKKHCGKLPSAPELMDHAKVTVSPDGTRVLTWDGEVILTILPPVVTKDPFPGQSGIC